MSGSDWVRQAACAGVADPEIFFTTRDQDPSEAEAICSRCPVRASCLEILTSDRKTVGTWGGRTRPVSAGLEYPALQGLEEKRARATAEVQRRIAAGVKPCSTCKEKLPMEKFHRQSNSADGRHSRCAACCSNAHRQRRAVAA